MKRLLVPVLMVNALLLGFRAWQGFPVVEAGGTAATDERFCADSNGDGALDISDAITILDYLFTGQGGPPYCIAGGVSLDQFATLDDLQALRDDLTPRLDSLEGQHPVEWNNIENRPSGLDDGDDVGLTSLIPPIPDFTYVETNAEGYPEYDHDATGIRFVRLPGGSFNMGSPETESGHFPTEGPVHTVSLSPFLIAKYEVTQAEYAFVMTGNTAGLNATPSANFGSAPASDQRPVEQVSWDDLHAPGGFLDRTGLSLPTEAQWEYACRAGTSGPYAGTGNLDDMGWYRGNSGDTGAGKVTHNVGTKLSNQFGLHDMHGNVYEWCEDLFDPNFYSSTGAGGPDPLPTSGSGDRVIRGGDYFNSASECRSAFRRNSNPSLRFAVLGFRPAYWPLP